MVFWRLNYKCFKTNLNLWQCKLTPKDTANPLLGNIMWHNLTPFDRPIAISKFDISSLYYNSCNLIVFMILLMFHLNPLYCWNNEIHQLNWIIVKLRSWSWSSSITISKLKKRTRAYVIIQVHHHPPPPPPPTFGNL